MNPAAPFLFGAWIVALDQWGDFPLWHIASLWAVLRYVRSWGKTGSGQYTFKTTRMTISEVGDYQRYFVLKDPDVFQMSSLGSYTAAFRSRGLECGEPASDIDTVVVDSLKALDPRRPIREADISRYGFGSTRARTLSGGTSHRA
jgi:hypothetical protein